MDQRTQDVLQATVNEYIKTGQPVSSTCLCEQYNFGVRGATIRAVLNHLTETGYLTQPHTSSGRMPTDAAYEFFVQKILERRATQQTKKSDIARELFRRFREEEKKQFTHDFAETLHLLGVCYDATRNETYKSGLDTLIKQLEIGTKVELLQIIDDFERIEERMATFAERWGSQETPHVYISANPITDSKHLSVIADAYTLETGNFLLMVIGPKRMNYREPLAMFTAFRQNTQHYE